MIRFVGSLVEEKMRGKKVLNKKTSLVQVCTKYKERKLSENKMTHILFNSVVQQKKLDKIEKGIKFNLFCSRFFPFWREGLLKPNKWRLFEFLVFRSFFSSISLFQTRHMFHQGKKNNNIETTKLDFFKIQIMLFYINYNQHINISSTSYYSRISCSEAPKVTKLSSASEIIVPIGYNQQKFTCKIWNKANLQHGIKDLFVSAFSE